VQPIIARAGSGELHWDICALDAPVVVGISVLGACAAAIADAGENTNIMAMRKNPYRITFSTG
jgi:threonine dehydrogenase-like Zn-dependent dehydrogenase